MADLLSPKIPKKYLNVNIKYFLNIVFVFPRLLRGKKLQIVAIYAAVAGRAIDIKLSR